MPNKLIVKSAKTIFEFNRITREEDSFNYDFETPYELIGNNPYDLCCGYYYGRSKNNNDEYDFIYTFQNMIKIKDMKIELLNRFILDDNLGNKANNKSVYFDRNFCSNVLTNKLDLFNLTITEIYYKKKILKKDNNYISLEGILSKEISSLLYKKYIKNSIFLIENKDIIVGYNKNMVFFILIENVREKNIKKIEDIRSGKGIDKIRFL